MKVSRAKISFTFVALIAGFMIAVQFQTVQEPEIRDTRDIWELRENLKNELDLQSRLLNEIRTNEGRIEKYESEISGSREEALRQTLEELKMEAGMTEATGPGIILTIETVDEALALGGSADTVSPVILKRLVNELNMFGAMHISIDGVRLINTSVIRDINGVTKVDNHPLVTFPFKIHVIAENEQMADRIYNQMQVSPSVEDFFIDNLRVKISKPNKSVVVPAHVDPIRIRYMEPAGSKGGG
ncbi:MAG TPA: DUF881 domain-containing protein [Bacillaceae bacterium]